MQLAGRYTIDARNQTAFFVPPVPKTSIYRSLLSSIWRHAMPPRPVHLHDFAATTCSRFRVRIRRQEGSHHRTTEVRGTNAQHRKGGHAETGKRTWKDKTL